MNSNKKAEKFFLFTFSNWLEQKGSSIKGNLNDDIIFNSSISLNDKRKRLLILFGPLIQSWFSEETNETPYYSLLRKNCVVQPEESCTDRCVYTKGNKCRIHIDEKYKGVNLANLLMFRLFDELLRYATKRKEIFNNEVSKLVFLDKAIRIGDQFILPEDSIEWSEFLRFEWTKDKRDMPKFFEEFSSKAVMLEDEEEEDDENEIIELPNIVKGILGAENLKTKVLKYYEITNEQDLTPVLELFDLEPEDVRYKGEPLFSKITLYNISLKAKGIVIIMINLTKIDFDITQDIIFSNKKNIELKNIYVIIISPTSTGLLVKNNKLEPLRFDDIPNSIKSLLQ